MLQAFLLRPATLSARPLFYIGYGLSLLLAAWSSVGDLYLTVSLGLTVSVLWEFGEWWGHNFVDPAINVGYNDTMGDLAAGGLGALLAGVLLALGPAAARAGASADTVPRAGPASRRSS